MIEPINRDKSLNFRDRLIEEFLVLESRLTLLKEFIKHNKTFKTLSFEYRFYMRMQYFHMKYYFRYVKKRLKYLQIDKSIIEAYISEENAKALIAKEAKERVKENIKDIEVKPKKKRNAKNKENKTNV